MKSYLHKLKIGNVVIPGNVCLAPMAGITDRAFRSLCKEQGASMVYTEMVSAKGLFYKDKKSFELTKIEEDERPCGLQIFGSEPDVIGHVCEILSETNADVIDINMGCPAPKVTKCGDGSALMKNPNLLGRVIKSAVNSSKKPITVKIRRGWNEQSENAVEIAKIAEANGAAAITVHGRFREQFYSGKSEIKVIEEVKKQVNIPVIANGDIFTPDDAVRMFERTGCDGIMIARGSLGNPWIFKRVISKLKDNIDIPEPTFKEKIEMAIIHMDKLIELKGYDVGVREIRKHIAWYIKGIRNSAACKNMIFKLNDRDEIEEALLSLLAIDSDNNR